MAICVRSLFTRPWAPLVLSLLMVMAPGSVAASGAAPKKLPSLTAEQVATALQWGGQSSFRLAAAATGGPTIAFDPVGAAIIARGKADLILISHSHSDHYVPADIDSISAAGAVVVGPPDCEAGTKFVAIAPGKKVTVKGISIEAVPAYNIESSYHTKDSGWVGYIVTVRGVRVYFAGDTDRIPEMKELKADVALLPIGGTYTMDVPQATKAALDIRAKVTIPMHYGTIVGDPGDGKALQKALKGKLDVMVKPAP